MKDAENPARMTTEAQCVAIIRIRLEGDVRVKV
jgi:hypothetical protein